MIGLLDPDLIRIVLFHGLVDQPHDRRAIPSLPGNFSDQ
jgi:hypothetical protein